MTEEPPDEGNLPDQGDSIPRVNRPMAAKRRTALTELAQFSDLIAKGGLSLALAFVIVGGMRGWFVWGTQYQEMVADRDYWRGKAESAMADAWKLIEMARERERERKP